MLVSREHDAVWITRLTAAVLGLLLFAVVPYSVARAATVIRVLDQPAISVRAPDKVTLIAIARAGHRLVAVGVHGVIIYSDDNGGSWAQASVPVGVLLTCVAFATSQDGWAAGQFGVILHSSDGGKTWAEQLNGNQVNQMMTEAANAALAVNPNSPVAQRALRRAGFFRNSGPDKPFLSILAIDRDNVMIFGAYRMLVRTTDGGKTWSDWSLHVADPLSHNLYGVGAVGADIFIAGEAGNDYVSTDAGNHFIEIAPPSPNGTTMFGVIGTGDGGVLLFGVAGEAYETHDEGKTWTAVSVGTTQNLTAAIMLRSGAILVTAEDGVIYISSDHAQTFHRLPDTLLMSPFDLQQAENGDVVIVGNLGVVRLPAEAFYQS